MDTTSTQPHARHTHTVLVVLVVLTLTIVVTSVWSGTMGAQRAALVTNIPSVSMASNVFSGGVPFGQNADELRELLQQIHSSYMSQMEMVKQLSQQNSSMLSLYQGTVSSVGIDTASASYPRSLSPLPPASSRSQSHSAVSSSPVSSSQVSSVVSSTVMSSEESSKTSSSSVSFVSSDVTSSLSPSSFSSLSPRLVALREAFGRTLDRLNAEQTSIAFRLMKELTLTPLGEEYILTFITQDLQSITMTPPYAAVVFKHFKLLNGNELKQLGVVSNADVDPKDWYAEPVITLHRLGVMKGSGKTGLFEADRPMNQAELAATLANAMNLAGGELLYPAADRADVFQAWPAWAKDAVSQLRARNIDTSFLRANPEEPVNRLQLARAISDSIFRGDTIDVTKARFFQDTVGLPPSVQQYVANMSSRGIMNGNPQTLMFEPYAHTNRAQVAKTIAYAISVKVGASTLTSSVAR